MTNTPKIEQLTIRTGRIINVTEVLLLVEGIDLADENIAHTGIALWREGEDWQKSSIEYNGVHVAVAPGKSAEGFHLCIIGDGGDYTELVSGKVVQGKIDYAEGMASIEHIDGSFVTVGIRGKIFSKRSSLPWQQLTVDNRGFNFESSCKYPSGGILVCGWEGGVALIKDSFATIDTGTNVILTNIICDEHGEILICGQKGTIIRGGVDSLASLDLGDITVDFWSIVKFKGVVYIASTTALYWLNDDDSLELVSFEGDVIPSTYYHLDNYEDTKLLSVGMKDAVVFDGESWERIL